MVHPKKLTDLASHVHYKTHRTYSAALILTTHCFPSKDYRHRLHIEPAIKQHQHSLPIGISSAYHHRSFLYQLELSGGFTKAISNNATYKVRSHNTHYKIHVPEIRSRLSAVKTENATEDKTTLCVALLGSSSLERFKITGEYLRTVLLGDSMFERFKTTVPASALNTRSDAINLGVGGDKIQNVLYRISLYLFDLLQPFPIKLWVIHVGSNNLNPKKGPLRSDDVNKLWLMLRAVFSRSNNDTKILLCSIFERRDMEPGQVSKSNELLLGLMNKMNLKEGRERVFWQPMPSDIDLKEHLADNAHLNREGYAIWDKILSTKIDELLECYEGRRNSLYRAYAQQIQLCKVDSHKP